MFFLYRGRPYTHAAAKHRIDAVVRGLIHIGVRRGDPVGVLMGTRPTALALVAALSRLGAVAVLLRPDGDPAAEARLGRVTRVIADPEHAARAAKLDGVQAYLLGGAGRGDRGPLTDMEDIDPERVEPPGWYRPNPGRAGDLAFVVFRGDGEQLRASRITNRRWALSAFGTASSAALSPSDTVYSITPLQHPSALLMSLGGAVAGGARLALASSYDPETFWDEARRYGVTVASYTWTSLGDLVNAPPNPAERHHAVRLFIGSGMPRNLWRRVEERFAPARVLEFYASTEGESVLVNLSGKKPGSLGRPLPGSAEVRPARYDLENGRLAEGPDGFAIECEPGEIGMLLARVRLAAIGSAARPVRGVFRPEDAWTITGDLFRRDAARRLLAGRPGDGADPHGRRHRPARPDPGRARRHPLHRHRRGLRDPGRGHGTGRGGRQPAGPGRPEAARPVRGAAAGGAGAAARDRPDRGRGAGHGGTAAADGAAARRGRPARGRRARLLP
ncbi:AMP-binding protein [Actinomadura madurae]|uniref:AMP-binding protein n=1 Tax=Actinomadura madurae TaxID=1993 RepID=UPI0020D23AB1|nr:AMP-binding protein [Actinomadura madurae]MCP9983257.1 AMP-binding protein [Actinomadura madurae]